MLIGASSGPIPPLMNKLPKDSISPWTLKFRIAEQEARYQQFDAFGDLSLTRGLLAVVGSYSVLNALYWALTLQTWTTFLSIQIGFGVGFAILYAVSLRPAVIRLRTVITSVAMIVSIGGVWAMIAAADASVLRTLALYWNLVMLTNSILSHRFRAKTAINLLALGISVYWFYTSGLFLADEMSAMTSLSFLTFLTTVAIAYAMESTRRRRFLAELDAQSERDRSDALLYNVLPKVIAERLKAGAVGDRIVDHGERVAVIFADIAGFTSYAATRTADQVVAELDGLFARFDSVMTQHGLEKIKTIGDAYMAIAGLPLPHADAAGAAAETALDMLAVVERLRGIGAVPFSLRIGVHIGPVVGGMIGRSRFLYDLWGDTVNVASRLESSGEAGKIQISAEMAEALNGRYRVESRGKVVLRGRGEVESYFLLGREMKGEAA